MIPIPCFRCKLMRDFCGRRIQRIGPLDTPEGVDAALTSSAASLARISGDTGVTHLPSTGRGGGLDLAIDGVRGCRNPTGWEIGERIGTLAGLESQHASRSIVSLIPGIPDPPTER